MAEKSGFFNAREAEDGTYDREYDAEQFAGYFANFISNGVYANPANQLKVVFNNSPDKPFVVIVRKGKAYIDGYWYELTEDMEITIPANTKAYIVKDVIRCTLDKAGRKVSIVLEEDVISDYPINNNNRHDLVLSTIIVQPNASKLNAEDVTDRRPDKTYCGFVTGVIDQIDTTELFQQYDDAFQEWFNEMKDQLSTDAAGNLQTQIGLLSNLKTIVKDSVVNAINSLYDSTIGKTLKTLEEVSSNTEHGHYVDALAVAELNKKLYETGYIFVEFGSLPSNTKKMIDINIPSSASQWWIKSAWATTPAGTAKYSIPHIDMSNWNNSIQAIINASKQIEVTTKSNWEGYPAYFIIAYK